MNGSLPSTMSTLIGGTKVPVGRLDDFLDFSPRPLDFRSVFARVRGGAEILALTGLLAFAEEDGGTSLRAGDGATVPWRCMTGRTMPGDIGLFGDEGAEGSFVLGDSATFEESPSLLSVAACSPRVLVDPVVSSLGNVDEDGDGADLLFPSTLELVIKPSKR